MANTQDERRQRHHRLLDELHDRSDIAPGQLLALKQLMVANPSYQSPSALVPLDEVEIRTDYALKIQEKIRRVVEETKDFSLNNLHIAMFCVMPLSTFQSGGELSPDRRARALHQSLEAQLPLVKHFLARWTKSAYAQYSKLRSRDTVRASSSRPSRPRENSTRESSIRAMSKIREQLQQFRIDGSEEDENAIHDTTFSPDDGKRNRDTVKRCKERDGHVCVLTGTSDPEVCHIVPFSWNDGRANILKTQCVFGASEMLMGTNWADEWDNFLANLEAPGGSDRVWNTICISPILHRWWAQAYFGLKCLGIVLKDKNTAAVEVQFHWMPRSRKDPTAPYDLAKENGLSKMVDEVKAFTDDGCLPATPRYGKIGASRIDLSCPLLSGHTFRVEMPPDDAGRFKGMLDFQWACILVAALSGAAGAPHLLPDHPGWADPDLRTLEWVEQQMLDGPVAQPSESPVAQLPERLDVARMPTTPKPLDQTPLQSRENMQKDEEDPSAKVAQRTETALAQDVVHQRGRVSENVPPKK